MVFRWSTRILVIDKPLTDDLEHHAIQSLTYSPEK